MSNKSKIEICANSVESAVKAQQAGAYRVELCAGIPEGGTTPSFGEIRMARQLLNQTKLHVIIRPRGGDFLYSPIEQEIMLHDIKVARQLDADGVVFGCLTAEGYVDVPLMHYSSQQPVHQVCGQDATPCRTRLCSPFRLRDCPKGNRGRERERH